MIGINSCDNSPLQSVAFYLNASLKTYLANNQDRLDKKFVHIRAMMETGLYLMDHRITEKEVELVGFEINGDPVCFILRTDEKLLVSEFTETALESLSNLSQERVKTLQQTLGFAIETPKP